MRTINRSLNGASVLFMNPIAALPSASVASILCADISDLLKRKDSTGKDNVGLDRFRAMLGAKTETANNLSPHITDVGERKAVLEAFGKAWDSAYDAKYLNQLMHENTSTGAHPYAGLVAAFGDNSTVSDSTKKVIVAAGELDKRRQTERHASDR